MKIQNPCYFQYPIKTVSAQIYKNERNKDTFESSNKINNPTFKSNPQNIYKKI